jgi:hypothetical protein
MNPQGAFVDDRIGPRAGDEPVLVDRLAGVFDKRDQNIESAAAEAQQLPVLEQQSLRGDQPERPEDEGFVIHRDIVLKTAY